MNGSVLYHFTCGHGHAGIEKTHALRPNIHPFMRGLGPLLWLTDLADPPTPESMGLQSTWIACNRMAHRYIVQCKAAIHWRDIRERAPKDIVADLESFGQPERWWIVRRPVLASEFALDATWRKVVTA